MVPASINRKIIIALVSWVSLFVLFHSFSGEDGPVEILMEGLVIISTIAILTFYLYRTLYQPLNRISRVMDGFLHGEETKEFDAQPNDEWGFLFREFKAVVAGIKQRDILLESMNKRLQEKNSELVSINESLVEADRMKTQFLAIVTHELKAPISTIRGYSEMMLDGLGGEVNDQHKEFLKEITESSLHLLEIVNDVLDYSKAVSGTLEMKFERFEINELLKGIETAVRPMIMRKGQTLDISTEARVGAVTGDRFRIRQVLLNLLSNAVKFTPSGGAISLKTFKRDGVWGIVVTDTGIGIDGADFARIFEPFRQLDSSYSRKYEGTGLGLAICRKILGKHHGRIWVESSLGKGSSFYIEMPEYLIIEGDRSEGVVIH